MESKKLYYNPFTDLLNRNRNLWISKWQIDEEKWGVEKIGRIPRSPSSRYASRRSIVNALSSLDLETFLSNVTPSRKNVEEEEEGRCWPNLIASINRLNSIRLLAKDKFMTIRKTGRFWVDGTTRFLVILISRNNGRRS